MIPFFFSGRAKPAAGIKLTIGDTFDRAPTNGPVKIMASVDGSPYVFVRAGQILYGASQVKIKWSQTLNMPYFPPDSGGYYSVDTGYTYALTAFGGDRTIGSTSSNSVSMAWNPSLGHAASIGSSLSGSTGGFDLSPGSGSTTPLIASATSLSPWTLTNGSSAGGQLEMSVPCEAPGNMNGIVILTETILNFT